MNTSTKVPAGEATIIMSRLYDAPRSLVWSAMTEAEHVSKWWGGPGFTNPVCEMDVRPGGLWRQVMRFPDGHELHLNFIFIAVERPTRLVWQHTDHGTRKGGPPTCITTVTLKAEGPKTRWTMVAQFNSLAERDGAVAMGFNQPIKASNDFLVKYLKTMVQQA
jgi:uncharacterized protein YndB with AHSA1/START domain